MTPQALLVKVIGPALAMLPQRMDTPEARAMLLATGLQESGFRTRIQIMPEGSTMEPPARGFWQFECGGATRGLMNHYSVGKLAHQVIIERGIAEPFSARDVWLRLAEDDILACALARLLLYTFPGPLPKRDDPAGGWLQYNELWQPGKPRPEEWPDNFSAAWWAVG